MKALWKKLLALALAAAMVLAAVPALAAIEVLDAAASSRSGDFDTNGELEPWQQYVLDYQESIESFHEKYAPKIRTLDNGVQVQRTPSDPDRVNTKIHQADSRGCGACHNDLVTALNSMTDISHVGGSFYAHHDFSNELGIELTYLQCLSCHQDSYASGLTYCMEFSSIIHGAHRGSAAFEAMGGDCWSCHGVDERTGEFGFWDEMKYDILMGINDVANVQGEFHYDQDVLTTDVYSLSSSYTWNMKDNAGVEPDPENDGVYDAWEITVNGMVENPVTYTLRELIENAPSETHIGTFECEINGYGGPFIENFEFTGIPIAWLIEQSVPTEEGNAFKNEFWGGPWSFEYLKDYPSYLVYEINGKTLSYKNGYPVMLYNMNGGAGKCIKNVTNIQVIHLDDELAYYDEIFGGGGAYKFDASATTHHPNVGICHFTEGMIIPVGKAYTFEGYANANHHGIAAIEFSMDGGETWTRFDTSDSQNGKWVYWYFTWTPEEAGAYVLSVRAYDNAGRTFDVPNEKLFNVQ